MEKSCQCGFCADVRRRKTDRDIDDFGMPS
jgi:hypothetical protein